MYISVVSDFTSLLCWVSKKKLEKAVRDLSREGYEIHVRFEPLVLWEVNRWYKENIHLSLDAINADPTGQRIVAECRKENIDLGGTIYCCDTTKAQGLLLYTYETLDEDKGNAMAEKLFNRVLSQSTDLKEDPLLYNKLADEAFGEGYKHEGELALAVSGTPKAILGTP